MSLKKTYRFPHRFSLPMSSGVKWYKTNFSLNIRLKKYLIRIRKTSGFMSVCQFWCVTEVCLRTITVTQDYHPRPPRPRPDWGRAPGLVLGGIWLWAQDSVSSLLTHFAHPEQPPSLCSPLIGCPLLIPASDWSLASPRGLDSASTGLTPPLHAAPLATLETFIYIKKCFNSSNKLHSKLVLIRICSVMPLEREWH